MKWIVAAALMVVAVPMTFTSCDDDPWDRYDGWYWDDDYYDRGGYYNDDTDQGNTVLDEADVLCGEWDGTMIYTNGDDGSQDRFYANMTFVRANSNAIKGTGTEVDYTLDEQGNEDSSQTLKFNWYINDKTGDIHIKYLTTNQTTFVMDLNATQHGFNLTKDADGNGTFSGYMIGTNTKDMILIDLKSIVNNEAKKAGVSTRATAATRSFGIGRSVESTATVPFKLTDRR